ncbi:MAG: multicopper oxidase domain-containing protein, partial [Gammaproteobacteria bacterium]
MIKQPEREALMNSFTITRTETARLMTAILFVTLMLAAAVMHVANAAGSSIYVQCPESTDNHPNANPSPGLDPDDIYVSGSADDGSQIKCDHLSAGDGVSTMADDDGKFLYIFGFDRIDMPDQGDAPAADSGNYPSYVMDQGTLAANTPAPTIIVDEDDEYFLNVTNTGMIMRPDLFDPHTIHWHGFPNASAIFDGLPDTSISVNMGATLTYYYLAKDAGTYMYHCHVEATEHMQMGMLGNLYVTPKQDGTTHTYQGRTYTKFAYNDG